MTSIRRLSDLACQRVWQTMVKVCRADTASCIFQATLYLKIQRRTQSSQIKEPCSSCLPRDMLKWKEVQASAACMMCSVPQQSTGKIACHIANDTTNQCHRAWNRQPACWMLGKSRLSSSPCLLCMTDSKGEKQILSGQNSVIQNVQTAVKTTHNNPAQCTRMIVPDA